MIEIIVDGKTAREKLFDSYIIDSEEKFTPKNEEIRKYCEFLKVYGFKDINYLGYFFVMEIDEEKYEKMENSFISNNEIFIFEFPDDYSEKVFYFKLKYCC